VHLESENICDAALFELENSTFHQQNKLYLKYTKVCCINFVCNVASITSSKNCLLYPENIQIANIVPANSKKNCAVPHNPEDHILIVTALETPNLIHKKKTQLNSVA
jgi:hypothetical protein